MSKVYLIKIATLKRRKQIRESLLKNQARFDWVKKDLSKNQVRLEKVEKNLLKDQVRLERIEIKTELSKKKISSYNKCKLKAKPKG